MHVPHVKGEDCQLSDISNDGFLPLTSDNGEIGDDSRPKLRDLGNSLRSDFDNGKGLLSTIQKSCGEECVIAIKSIDK